MPPNCFPPLWAANSTPFHCTMMIPGVLPGGKIIWKSTSSTLNYLPPEFEQRDEVEFVHSFHLTRSGSCFSRRLLDIPVTRSRHPRKHSPGTEQQLSLLNRTAKEKQILDVAWNKTRGWWNISQGERLPQTSSKRRNSNLRQIMFIESHMSDKWRKLFMLHAMISCSKEEHELHYRWVV